jgi:hypothetical protein
LQAALVLARRRGRRSVIERGLPAQARAHGHLALHTGQRQRDGDKAAIDAPTLAAARGASGARTASSAGPHPGWSCAVAASPARRAGRAR